MGKTLIAYYSRRGENYVNGSITFLESYDFTGKRIIPFCTNEGSGMGSSVRFIKKLCPGATVEDGISIHGAEAANADSEAREIADMAKINNKV